MAGRIVRCFTRNKTEKKKRKEKGYGFDQATGAATLVLEEVDEGLHVKERERKEP